MTNSFKEKLGQGGFDGVFKGKLPDGRLVAVKVLNDFKGNNGEDFINEVESISKTSHVHIVTFLGFCFDGSKRALIYNKKSIETCPHLGWDRLHQIAVGIARGLEYLHCGCNTRILHFDIKPHNILLNEDFCPKISDFGLAKLCPKNDSIISMSNTRGTIGYIAPEVFSRNFGGVLHKSDVYSYGMMVLEMVGGRKNFDKGVDHTSEIYFQDWIYEHIGQSEHLQLDMVMTKEEEEIVRKMVLVGLWCIQMDPLNRPSISKVVEMLEGNLEALPIPPKPFLSSPSRQLDDSSTRSIS
ncbi:LEAF RUST 10 DISEASE-RESISTANCE LOCUS RECEPTOR-LIKE PROTEIN KINASE-like 2.4 [Telopea speciosissima]|uniref:LEAF RUST 10 DISEASE-RESISTANCE LOCUS RECEPTOR-LIKE PROTEIN KINASE-like 2.4 n=1 Tax=Telopea speciosissima TaxID=54955 RepID=UPI001CC3F2D0|nr:LEAF RUST 10 DISEASE-RESISTANCE LOCUS RECEPTOR-LIKE PROTEIN KINASE-like 2.4 [Telopea speciosissima]